MILLPLSSAQAPSVHPVEFHKVAISTKLIEVLVIFPEIFIITTLVAGHFIEDAKVFFIFIFRIKSGLDRLNQISLLVGHLERIIINICLLTVLRYISLCIHQMIRLSI